MRDGWDGLQSMKTGVAGEGHEGEREQVPVKLCSDVKQEKYLHSKQKAGH